GDEVVLVIVLRVGDRAGREIDRAGQLAELPGRVLVVGPRRQEHHGRRATQDLDVDLVVVGDPVAVAVLAVVRVDEEAVDRVLGGRAGGEAYARAERPVQERAPGRDLAGERGAGVIGAAERGVAGEHEARDHAVAGAGIVDAERGGAAGGVAG